MSNTIVETADNSFTLFSDKYNQHFHSVNGALAESLHIFVNLGLKSIPDNEISILEIGYGTGLNAIVTFCENVELKKRIFYHGIDVHPIDCETIYKMGFNRYTAACGIQLSEFCDGWGGGKCISENFTLLKQEVDLQLLSTQRKFQLIYFDAFSPEAQPEMWTSAVFKKLSTMMTVGGILVTYCSKGIVKQNLREAGFDVKRFPGPVGKRHILRATKI